jgi:glycosyltransferase involved in cell wall biosynthesis
MARALVVAGHDVTMICGTYHGGVSGLGKPFKNGKRVGRVAGFKVIELELDYSNYHSFLKRSWVFFRFAMRSIGIALNVYSDLIFATSTPLTAGLPGIFARWLKGTRFVFEVRDLWPELPREMGVITNPMILWTMSFLEWLSYRSAHSCIGLSPGIVEGIKRRSSTKKPIAMIPNGCDFDLFTGKEIEARRPDGVSKTDFIAIFAGAHGIANGLSVVLSVAELLHKRGRDDIKIVFIGDGRLKPELQSVAKDKELTNCIFLDPVPKNSLVSYLKGADIGLMILANVRAFYFGTSPNKFFDYLSVGLPVLNNYPGWLADLITEYSCGYAAEPNNPELFASALEDAADHPEKIKKMSSKAFTLGKDQFDRKILAGKFVNWLERE